MTGEMALFIGRRALETGMLLSAPVLIVALLLGILVSLFQAVTSMRDMSLSIVVKIAGVAATLLIAGGWMLQVSLGFMKEIFDILQAMTR